MEEKREYITFLEDNEKKLNFKEEKYMTEISHGFMITNWKNDLALCLEEFSGRKPIPSPYIASELEKKIEFKMSDVKDFLNRYMMPGNNETSKRAYLYLANLIDGSIITAKQCIPVSNC